MLWYKSVTNFQKVIVMVYFYLKDVVGHIASAPTYHPLHDNFDYVKWFVDPDFRQNATVTQVWLLAALQLADDVILPMNYTNYALIRKSCAETFFKKYTSQLADYHMKLVFLRFPFKILCVQFA